MHITINLLADTGTTYSVINKTKLERIGIVPFMKADVELANGSTSRRDLGTAIFKTNNRETAAGIVFGEPNDDEVLSVTALAQMGFEFDNRTGELKKIKTRM